MMLLLFVDGIIYKTCANKHIFSLIDFIFQKQNKAQNHHRLINEQQLKKNDYKHFKQNKTMLVIFVYRYIFDKV